MGFGEQPISYLEGRGRKIYLSDLKYYDDGIANIEVTSGDIKATEIDETLWCIEVLSSAKGNFEAEMTVTYDGWDGEDPYILHFEGTPAKDDRTMRDKADKTVDLTIGAGSKDTLIAVDGAVSENEPILIATYGEHGRFMGLTLVKNSGEQAAVSADAEATKVFWIDASFAPKCSAEAIDE